MPLHELPSFAAKAAEVVATLRKQEKVRRDDVLDLRAVEPACSGTLLRLARPAFENLGVVRPDDLAELNHAVTGICPPPKTGTTRERLVQMAHTGDRGAHASCRSSENSAKRRAQQW